MDHFDIRRIINEELLSEEQSRTMIKVMKKTANELSYMIQKYKNSTKMVENEVKYGLDATFINDLESAFGKLKEYTGFNDIVIYR